MKPHFTIYTRKNGQEIVVQKCDDKYVTNFVKTPGGFYIEDLVSESGVDSWLFRGEMVESDFNFWHESAKNYIDSRKPIRRLYVVAVDHVISYGPWNDETGTFPVTDTMHLQAYPIIETGPEKVNTLLYAGGHMAQAESEQEACIAVADMLQKGR